MSHHHPYTYQGEVLRVADGVAFGRRQVPDAQLEPGRAQLLFLAQRQGKLPADPSGSEIIELPVFEGHRADEISSLKLAVGEGANRVEREFDLGLFQSFVETMTAELIQAKQLEAGSEVKFRAYAEPSPPSARHDDVVVRVKRESLPLLEGGLDDFLADAQISGPINETDYPVFLLESALEQARACSWKGRSLEGGAWLIGNLYTQQKPRPEIFALIHTVLEARGASHERFSLDLTTETFADTDAQLQRRRKRFGRVGEVKMGFYHTHPFLPSILDGREACPDCRLRAECNLTSSFFSKKDAQFHAALFGRAPYAVEMVLGLTPREEFDLRMFCLDGGHFRERGYYRLAESPAVVPT